MSAPRPAPRSAAPRRRWRRGGVDGLRLGGWRGGPAAGCCLARGCALAAAAAAAAAAACGAACGAAAALPPGAVPARARRRTALLLAPAALAAPGAATAMSFGTSDGSTLIPAEEMEQADREDRGVWIQRAPTRDELVNSFVQNLQVFAVANREGSPVLEAYPDGSRVGRFYLSQDEAAAELRRLGAQMEGLQVLTLPMEQVYLPLVVRGDEKELGGRLALQPGQGDVQAARARLGRTLTDVPLFLCQDLLLGQGAEAEVPLFLHEGDLSAALGRVLGPKEAEAATIQVTTLQAVASQILEGSANGERAPRFVAIGGLADLG